MKIWEPKPPKTPWATRPCYGTAFYISIYWLHVITSQNTVILTLSNLRKSYLIFVTVFVCQTLTIGCNKSSTQPRFQQLVHVRFVQVFVAVHDDLKHNGCHLTQVCSIEHILPMVCDGRRGHRIVPGVTPICDRMGILFRTSRCAYITYGKKSHSSVGCLKGKFVLAIQYLTVNKHDNFKPKF